MAFCLQLKLLIWKNLLVRSRQKTRFCVEMIWPLFLFIVLAWIRNRGFKHYYDTCYLTEKSLLSAGFTPFVHSFFCTFNNTCFNSEKGAEPKLGKFFQEGGMAEMYAKLNSILFPPSTLEGHSFEKEMAEISENFKNVLSALNGSEKGNRSYVQIRFDNAAKRIKNIRNELWSIREFSDKDPQHFETLPDVIRILKEYLCNDTNTDFEFSDDLEDEGFQSFGDDLLQFASHRTNDSLQDERCTTVAQELERHKNLKFIWRVVKPFFVGKILYTPVTNVTKAIMDRVDQYFTVLKVLKPLAGGSTNPRVRRSVYTESVSKFDLEYIQTFLRSEQSYNYLNKSQIRNYKKDIKRLRKLLKIFDGQVPFVKTFQGRSDFLSANDLLACIEENKVEGFNDLMKAEHEATELGLRNRLWGLIQFTHFEKGGNITPFVNYTIRVNAAKVDDTQFVIDKVRKLTSRSRPHELKYLTNGFIYLQDMVERSIVQEITGKDEIPGVILKQVPYPCHIYDSFIAAVSSTFPFFMVMSWIYTCSMIVKAIVYEKEQRLKETMRVMGLGNEIHWLGWFIDSLIPMMITVTLLTLILVYGRVMGLSNPIIIFLFLTCYTLACISFSFFISVFFSKANIAAASAGIIFFLLYIPFPFLMRWLHYLTDTHKLISCLSMNVALGFGSYYIATYEEAGEGIQWNNLRLSPQYNDTYSLQTVMFSLLIDFCIFLILTWYLENIIPGEYGIPKPWYFPLIEYRTVRKRTTETSYMDHTGHTDFEEEPDLEPGVVINNLTKIYSNGKVAVNKLSLSFFEGQITSLLGHNGAGKTTTISMLMGMYKPTHGDAYVNGYSIRKEIHLVRKSLGVCPQHNVLFDKLTVEEHMIFYGQLRSGKTEKLNDEIKQMLEDLNLERKKGAFPNDLSGGMQRKLSIAVAYIGGAKTVILDEPTSGVDPYSRRSIWELLIKYKKDRTIILTTHYMDEADLLSDRVAIISKGQVRCAGSVIFLKSRFGKGYQMKMELIPIADKEKVWVKGHQEFFNVEEVTAKLQKAIPDSTLDDQKGAEVKYTLPERNSAKIANLCDLLDSSKEELHIASYEITDCSLEEIFLTVTSQDDQRMTVFAFDNQRGFFKGLAKALSRQRGSLVSGMTQPSQDFKTLRHGGRASKYKRQFFALMVKRFHHSRRSRKAILSEWISPPLLVLASLIVLTLYPKLHERNPKPIDFIGYNEPRYVFYQHSGTDMTVDTFIDDLSTKTGFGTVCIPDPYTMERNPLCERAKFINDTRAALVECSCETGMLSCPDEIDEPLPPRIKTSSHELLLNLEEQPLPFWLVNTYPRYEISRLGGLEINVPQKIPKFDLVESMTTIMKDNPNFKDVEAAAATAKPPVAPLYTTAVWFNTKAWHSSVVMVNAHYNGILRAWQGGGEQRGHYGILAINHPLNFTPKELEIEVVKQSGRSILNTIAILFSLSFVPASFTLFLIDERVSKAKHLQLSSGLNIYIYWAQTFIWDMMVYITSCSLCFLLFFLFSAQEYISNEHVLGTVTLFLLYGWAIIPAMYAASFIFAIPSSSFVALACMNIFLGVVTTLVPFILDSFKDKDIINLNKGIKRVFLIFPQFCLGQGLMKLSKNHNEAALLSFYESQPRFTVFEWDFLGANLVTLAILGFIFFILTFFLEFKFFKPKFQRVWTPKTVYVDEDEDVTAEKERVKQPDCNDTLIITELYKKYKRKPEPSVRGVSLGVRPGECFGLLGINGAGKTTTFKMLTGETKITSGDAKIMGHSVRTELEKVRSLMGYCPQFDALNPLLTTQETLKLYAEIRNIHRLQVTQTIDDMIEDFGLANFRYRLAGDLSGGNKRKLSTAIALMGKPPVIYLDEPTTGMDPQSRRFLWSCIEQMINSGTCVILTSHSMEECQALCTRLTIMVNGQFKCLGSCQYLKQKYGKGYQIIVRFQLAKREEVKAYVASSFPTAVLDEEHFNQMRYHVPSVKVSKIFLLMEKAKEKKIVTDFSVSQTTLEEVFMKFAQEQEKEEEIKPSIPFWAKVSGFFAKKHWKNYKSNTSKEKIRSETAKSGEKEKSLLEKEATPKD